MAGRYQPHPQGLLHPDCELNGRTQWRTWKSMTLARRLMKEWTRETNFFSCFEAETDAGKVWEPKGFVYEIISAADTAVATGGVAVMRHRSIFGRWPVRIQAATPNSYDVWIVFRHCLRKKTWDTTQASEQQLKLCSPKSNENTNLMQHCAGFISAGSLYTFRASSVHHQEYLKLVQRPLVHVFCKNI